MQDVVALQDRGWFTDHTCFGCGPQNEHGLRLKSYRSGDDAWVATWTPEPFHIGPPGTVHGGVVAVPMDCHAAFVAIDVFRRRAEAAGRPPDGVYAVTGAYSVRLHAPTPIEGPIELRATAGEPERRKVEVEVTSSVGGTVTATFTGTMIEIVDPGLA